MPRTKLGRPEIDRARALILERKRQYKKTNLDLATHIGVSERTFTTMLNAGTGTWPINKLFSICRYLDIEKAEIKELL